MFSFIAIITDPAKPALRSTVSLQSLANFGSVENLTVTGNAFIVNSVALLLLFLFCFLPDRKKKRRSFNPDRMTVKHVTLWNEYDYQPRRNSAVFVFCMQYPENTVWYYCISARSQCRLIRWIVIRMSFVTLTTLVDIIIKRIKNT